MTSETDGAAREPSVVDRWADGFGWIARPDETMRRASHALRTDAGVFVVDPVDAPGVDERLAESGDVAGVVVLLDRHQRDADAIARRHDVPVYRPRYVDGSFRAPVETLAGTLPGTEFAVHRTVSLPGWSEAALFDGETLVVADALGTVDYFLAPGERFGVHPFLRLRPPRRFRGLEPRRILVGHGAGVSGDATPALRVAIDGARRRLPAAWWNALTGFASR